MVSEWVTWRDTYAAEIQRLLKYSRKEALKMARCARWLFEDGEDAKESAQAEAGYIQEGG